MKPRKKPYRKTKLVHGVGKNDADYPIFDVVEGKQILCPFYRTWRAMLERCYSKASLIRNPTYKDVFVCEEWLVFSSFKTWMEGMDWIGKVLDKDILSLKNKIYSPETCVFIYQNVNNLLLDRKANRGHTLIGACFDKSRGKYISTCNDGTGKLKFLGRYETEIEAHAAYVRYKIKIIKKVAESQSDLRVRNGLYSHAELIASNAML